MKRGVKSRRDDQRSRHVSPIRGFASTTSACRPRSLSRAATPRPAWPAPMMRTSMSADATELGGGERAYVVHGGGVLERGEVAEVLLAQIRASDDAAEDLRVARLRQLRDEADRLGPQRLAEELRDLVLYLALERGRSLAPWTEHAEDDDPLSFYLVRHAHRGRLAHRGPDAFARDLQRVVAAPLDVPVAVVIDARPVAVLPYATPATPIRREVATALVLRVLPEAARHPRPRLANDELAHGAAHRTAALVDDVGVHARHRSDERTRLDRRPGRAAHDASRYLGAA